MKKILLISDTHNFLDPILFQYIPSVDEIWHAGDIGDESTLEVLKKAKPLRAVFGNIDTVPLQKTLPEWLSFECEGVQVLMTHIGGYPGKYPARVKDKLKSIRPHIFICGHSHILRILQDEMYSCLYMNPGACGNEGFHHQKTALLLEIGLGKINKVQVLEMGKRGKI